MDYIVLKFVQNRNYLLTKSTVHYNIVLRGEIYENRD